MMSDDPEVVRRLARAEMARRADIREMRSTIRVMGAVVERARRRVLKVLKELAAATEVGSK